MDPPTTAPRAATPEGVVLRDDQANAASSLDVSALIDDGAITTMGRRSKTETVDPHHRDDTDDTHLECMMVRSATEGVTHDALPLVAHSGDINYDLDLPTAPSASRETPHPQLDRYRARTLRQPFESQESRRMFNMSFDEWKAVDRHNDLPGWSCSVASPIGLDRIVPIAPTDVHILDKVALVRCGVTDLALDAIVNAANEECLGGGGVDGAVHRAAGPLLVRECSTFAGCRTGHTRMTKGYALPSRFVLHTVGPMGQQPKLLRSCYASCMQLAKFHKLRTIGFCCVSTGIFGYPLVEATTIALTETFSFLKKHREDFDMLCFACYTDREYEVYRHAVDQVYREVMTHA